MSARLLISEENGQRAAASSLTLAYCQIKEEMYVRLSLLRSAEACKLSV